MSERFAFINGGIVPLETACVSILDRGLMYGDGLFETIRVVGGKAVRLERHLARLHAGAHILRFGESLRGIDFASAVASVCEANGLTDARVRLTVTRGLAEGPGRLLPSGATSPTVAVTADPLPAANLDPARVVISSIRRDEKSPLCGVKSLNYLPGILARAEAADAGADDAILLNTQGNVAETTIGNIFLVKGRELITPSLDQGPLPGTVREAVLALAPDLGLNVIEAPLSPDELLEVDELFLTNAIQLARPIGQVGGTAVGNGKGEVCGGLLTLL